MSENREKLLFLLEDLSECYNGTLRSTDISKNVDYVMNVTSSSNMKIDENQWIQMYLVEMKEDEEKKEKIIKIFSKLDDAFPPEYLSKLFKFLWLLRNSSSNLNRSTTHLSSKSKDEINDRPNESNINKSTSLMNIMKKKRISNNNNNNNNNNSNNYLSSSSSMNYDNRYRSMSGLSSTKQSFNLLDNSATYCMRLQRNLLSSSPLYVNKENVKCMEIWSRFIRLSLDVEREELRNVTYNLIDIPSSSYQSSTGRLLPSMRLKQLIQNERNETITKSSEFQNLISSVDLDIYHNCWRKRFQLIPQLTEQIHQFLRNEHHSLYVQALQQFIEEELMKFRSLVASLQRGLLPPHPHLTFIRMRLILVDAIVELRILLKIIKLFPEKNLLTNLYEMMENEINILSKRLIERALLAAMHPFGEYSIIHRS
ncbi:hypothetical protein SNEBB_007926 [Seison nebaliae]|nr:hypothetical protein SNEBB_007926 [Seison nebaliae]